MASATPVELFAAPGSDAIGELGTCIPLAAEDVDGLTAWCGTNRPDLVVVGPEAPLVAGLADALRRLGIPVFGHDAATARLEGSKAFAKDFMARHGIPCAFGATCRTYSEAETILRSWTGYPIVLKADGLAGGKGVQIVASETEALVLLGRCLDGAFGDAYRTMVVEECLQGVELSLHVLVDVNEIVPPGRCCP
jgi:phosphoribosylamine-glycine ligase